jgi:hypothetical protein
MKEANKKPDNAWLQHYVDQVNAGFKAKDKPKDRKDVIKEELAKKQK